MKLQTLARRAAASAPCAVALTLAALTAAYAADKEPLTVTRALETVRIMNNPGAASPVNPDGAVSVSPDGQRYLVRLVRGDVQRNGVWMEMLTGRLDSFEGARTPKPVARLFTTGLGAGIGSFGADLDVSDYFELRWLDNERVAFLWSDERSIRQLMSVDLDTGKVERLTSHSTPVSGFDLSHSGTVLYTARANAEVSTADELRAGFVLPDTVDAYSIFHRNLRATGFDIAWNTEWFIQDSAGGKPRALQVAGRDIDLFSWHRISFAPDARLALLSSAPERYPEEWDRYGGPLKPGVAAARRDVRSPGARNVQQLFVVDIASGTTRPLWNTLSLGSELKWSDDGRSVLVTSTYLPAADADADGLEGRATAVVDVATGQLRRVPIDLRGREVLALRWLGIDEIQIDSRKGDDTEHARFRNDGAEWQRQVEGEESRENAAPPVRIEVRQDLDKPPRLYAVELRGPEASRREEMILDPNPGLLETVALGRSEIVSGKLDGEDSWQGLLFYPVGYRPGQRYPLLIQSIYGGNIQSKFTLYGLGNLGPTLIAPYPGRILAARDIAVLVLDVQMGAKVGGTAEGETRKNAFIAAAEHLVAEGIADRAKIGLAGFSRNGWYTEYTLTHSDFPFAAAIAADNWDPSYAPTVWLDSYAHAGAVNGAEPFGEGLKAWLEKAPGFNADRVRVPLLKIEQSTGGLFGVMTQWEMFGRLRYLKKPVEFYVMPLAAEHGAHNTQNPRQIMAVQQRAVDWFEFWLHGREDQNPQKAGQYARWRELREAHEADLARLPGGNGGAH
jgi:dipeptidyl aminopeptidase/acylaminoacyl peptidase